MKTIRLIHNLPRSGGTIISKCLSAQRDIVLLSEIHPEGVEIWKKMKKPSKIGDPIYQSQKWYNLFSKKEYEKITNTNLNFLEKIDLIYEKTNEFNKKLILRDWSFIDFFGFPYAEPTFKNCIFESLIKKFDISNFYILRHPLEQYISCFNSFSFFRKLYNFDFFIRSYEKYLSFAVKNKIFKYEDFSLNTENILKEMCKILDINFDKDYLSKLNDINITGDKKAINSRMIKKKENIAQNFFNKEDKNRINNNLNFIKLMKSLNGYY
tara:strand:- start:740 stop:1540 length:801 start_codon:yes stop_codon:yes gene_type:complete